MVRLESIYLDQSRSMLALFQESAIRVMNSDDGLLVSICYFMIHYINLSIIQHSQVISDAESNSKLVALM